MSDPKIEEQDEAGWELSDDDFDDEYGPDRCPGCACALAPDEGAICYDCYPPDDYEDFDDY